MTNTEVWRIAGAVFQSTRPKQWTKNLIVFAAIIFTPDALQLMNLGKILLAFVIFSLLSGSVYLLNDIADREQDKHHPLKSRRPVASGQLSLWPAILASLLFAGLGIVFAFTLDAEFGIVATGYFLLILAYSFSLKHIFLLDVLIVALGFVFRTIAGAIVINIPVSPLLLIITFFWALYLVLCKRRAELVLSPANSTMHRKILSDYKTGLLDQMITAAMTVMIVFYVWFTISNEMTLCFGNRNLLLTVPFFIYGAFRYLYLVHTKQMGGTPEQVFFKDRPMLINVVLYLIIVITILISSSSI